ALLYDASVLLRSTFVEPCLPSPAKKPPRGPGWLHEIKHDGFRLLARRDPAGVRLFTRNGHDWSARFALIREAVGLLPTRSCLIAGEAIAFDDDGLRAAARATPRPARDALRLRSDRAGRQGPTGASPSSGARPSWPSSCANRWRALCSTPRSRSRATWCSNTLARSAARVSCRSGSAHGIAPGGRATGSSSRTRRRRRSNARAERIGASRSGGGPPPAHQSPTP